MPSASSALAPQVFALELVKLLLQVAWADHELGPAEAEVLLAYARRNGLEESQLRDVAAMLSGSSPLVPPNLGLLKERRPEVMRAVRELLLSDRAITAEEDEVLSQIAALLS